MMTSLGSRAVVAGLAGVILAACATCPTQPLASLELTASSVEDCPVSKPNVGVSPHDHFVSTDFGYQNSDGSLFTNLPPQGELYVVQTVPDGSLGPVSLFWYLEGVYGLVTIQGMRIDGPSSELEYEFVASSETGEGPTGPQLGRVTFPN